MVHPTLKSIVLGVFLTLSAQASISSTSAQWEVRTTGNDSNGGFFVPGGGGTDFSQQDAAQFNFTDLASANGTTNPCVVTSASHNFVAADVGNAIHVSAGTNWTAGWHQIVSVATNAATLDRACGSAVSLTGGTWFEGGGLATITGAMTAVNSITGTGTCLDIGTVYVKTGTYTLTTTTLLQQTGVWQGYQITHGDFGTAPTITTATNSITLFNIRSPGNNNCSVALKNLNLTNTAVTRAVGFQTDCFNNLAVAAFQNVSFSGFSIGVDGSACIKHPDLINVEIKNSTGVGLRGQTGNSLSCYACWIHDNAGGGIGPTANGGFYLYVANSVISSNTGAGITNNAQTDCFSCDVASNTGDGFNSGGSVTLATALYLYNSIIYGNGGWGVNWASGQPRNTSQNNAFGANTSGARTNYDAGLNDITLTASPFTSATNFALNNAVGGGALLKGTGFPGVFPGGLTTGYLSVGAVQPAASSGASCTGACKIR